jgi:hypothetical protein
LTPLGANDFLLLQLGEMLGIPPGGSTLTSVFVQFTGTPGFVIGAGFLVGDGNFQYQVIDGGVVGSDGVSPQLFAQASQSGTWAVPAGTVTNILSNVPNSITLSVINPVPGIPGDANGESAASYRSRVLNANYAAAQGVARYLRTIVAKVPNVQSRLILPIMQEGGGCEIIVGGGDPIQVAYAIYSSLFDISMLVGSVLKIASATAALPAVVTTFLNHLFSPGQVIEITGANPSGYNGTFTIVTVPTEKTFSLGVTYLQNAITGASWSGGTATLTTTTPHGVTVGSSISISGVNPVGYNVTNAVATAGTTGSTIKYAVVSDPGIYVSGGDLLPGVALYDTTGIPYVSGGVITPNLRNQTPSIIDWPDTFVVPYVNPPVQTVTMTVNWHTSSANFVSAVAIAQAAAPALANYINSINVGQPINVLLLESTFQAAVLSILPSELISVLTFSVSINGVGTPPVMGTELIEGDPESYFLTDAASINVVEI